MPSYRHRTLRLLSFAGVVGSLWLTLASAQEDAGSVAAAPVAALARPALGDLEQRVRLLFDAIVHDDPAMASSLFFPRAAFLLVKAMQDPGRYYDKLEARYVKDIHTLHRTLPDLEKAAFDHLELARRGGLVKPGEEGNRLPYWASRHSTLVYRVGAERRRIELRVFISWEDRWYLIHLLDF